MNSPGGWAKALVKLFVISAPVSLLTLAACQSSPAEFNLQYACLQPNLPPCLLAEEFAARVADRTDGRVRIEITSIPDLLGREIDEVPRLEDGTLEMAEIYAAHFFGDGDRAVLDILDLWGLYPDFGTQEQVTEAIRKEIEGIIAKRSRGLVLAVQFYPSNYLFSRRPLRTVADIQGLRIRSHNTLSDDLLDGMGAIAEHVTFDSVSPNLQSGNLGAAISCSSCGVGLRWYYVAAYLVGPIPALGHSWITINGKIWSELPPDIQLIIREEAKRHEVATKEASLARWDQRGVQKNLSEGMVHIELTPELKELMLTASLTTVLPNWVRRAGGPNSKPVMVFNEKVAPIVKVAISQDGTAKEIY